MKTIKKYKCTCTSGGGTEQESYWDVIIMPKTIKLKCVDIDTIWGNAEEDQEFTINLNSKKNKHALRIWEEDLSDFTLYPNQSGTPYHFELIL